MRFLDLEACSDGELHCLYHDPERTITLLQPRTSCALHFYAPRDDPHSPISTFLARRPNAVHSWWRQALHVTRTPHLSTAQHTSLDTTLLDSPPEPPLTTADTDAATLTHLSALLPSIPHTLALALALDPAELLASLRPLPTPWHWPPHAHYLEARRNALIHLPESLIPALVTQGVLVVDAAGIRWAVGDACVLVADGECSAEGERDGACARSRTQQWDMDAQGGFGGGCGVRACTRPRIALLDLVAFRRQRVGALAGHTLERPGPPVVGPAEPRCGKKVRILAERQCVGPDGARSVEALRDNEGRRGCARRKWAGEKGRRRGAMCWDSERGF
ncbi:hypothetical protein C7974DRAFT_446280 [Boeremia exigua]|uniref:uncharacterized protein n=1 Tax=Boeremia exigua TaxID=749465 RepID=UPI001E8DD096|nr:uncharacterized protein C7974DRAFT_446280 [Boeremia exigua]KAH6641983.1 hypothetical protein C7974DRAFT_446280 [Boeremia exigua]